MEEICAEGRSGEERGGGGGGTAAGGVNAETITVTVAVAAGAVEGGTGGQGGALHSCAGYEADAAGGHDGRFHWHGEG